MRLVRYAAIGLVLVAPAFAGAIIGNGSGVYLGVDNFGQLIVTNGTGGVNLPLTGFTDSVGLYSALLGRDGASEGCFCEGWGVAADSTYLAGADNGRFGTKGTFVSFSSTASTATSTVTGGGLTISHAFAPSTSASLFQGTVTITNHSDAVLSNLLYRRLIDFDAVPTANKEYITIQGWPAGALYRSSNGGFQVPNPLMPIQGVGTNTSLGPGGCPDNANFTDCGPFDQGALFDFNFGTIAPGQSISFKLYYGLNRTEQGALSALASVGAEVYALAQSFDDRNGTGAGPDGSPRVTFMLGFSGVGGAPVSDPAAVPEPASVSLGAAALAVGYVMRRRRIPRLQGSAQ